MTPFDITFRKDGEAQSTVLTAGEDFRFDVERLTDFFAAGVSAPMVDLLRIGMAAFVVDRLSRRRRRVQQRHWSRSLKLKVGVLEPSLWNTDEIRDCLIECLEFLSDDTWSISFKLDDRRGASDVQRRLFTFEQPPRVCLYSGGLDSAAGLASQVLVDSVRSIVPVTVWHQGGQRHNVLRQLGLINEGCDRPDIVPLIFKAHLYAAAKRFGKEESSQRSRSFLFTAAGAAAATMSGSSEVEIYESGVGAVNLPLMAGMTGSRTTRSAHPEFLRLMSRLVSLVANQDIKFTLPFLEKTKGQIVTTLAENGLSDLAKATVSCVHFPLREKPHKQCGVCPACLFRRQAMLTAGIHEPANSYKYDLFDTTQHARTTSDRELRYLKAFLMQVAELEHVRSGRRLPERIRRHLMGTNILRGGESAAPFIRLLSNYRKEWLDVTAQAKARGFAWTNLIAPIDSLMEGAPNASNGLN